MTEYDLGKVVGDDGTDGATIWTTSTAPSTPDYTFTISNLTGPTGATPNPGDIIIYSYYWYQISTVSSTTVLAGNRTSIRGAAGQNGTNGTNGTNGDDGVGISSISKTGTSGKVDTYTITYTNSDTDTFTVTNGNDGTNGTNGTNGTDGSDGVGIASIEKTGTSGLVDTYTITYTDSDTDTFTVTNGANGTNGTNGTNGKDGSSFWTTTTAPTTPNYTFTISNLSGDTGATLKVGDIIFYSYYRYTVDTVGDTTVYCTTRQSIRGSQGAAGTNGTNGTDGVGISSITKTGTSGLVDTYTITYTDTNTSTFTVTNGSDASVTIVTSTAGWSSTTSDSKVPSEKLVKNSLDSINTLIGNAIDYINQ